MKNILYIILSYMFFVVHAQNNNSSKPPTATDIQKMMDDAMKDLSPEEKEMAKEMFKGMSNNVNDAVNVKPENSNLKTPSTIGEKTTKIIGPEGGEIISENGKIKLSFPLGALSKKTEIRIEEVEELNESSVGNSFQLLPEGLQFGQPVTLSFRYDEKDLTESAAEDFTIITEANNGDFLFSTLSKVDTISHTVSTEIHHFSKWSLGSRRKIYIAPQESTLNKDESIKFSVQVNEMVPVNAKGKEEIYKKNKEKQKQLKNAVLSSELEQIGIEKDMQQLKWKDGYEAALQEYNKKYDELKKVNQTNTQEKIKLESEIKRLRDDLGISEDDMATFLMQKKIIESSKYNVINWRLNTTKAPISNAFGSLTPMEKLTAKYTAPKTFPSTNKPVMIYADVLTTSVYKKAFVYKLSAKVNLIDKGYLNYTFDGKETKTFEFGFSSQYQNILKKDVDKATNETPVAQAIYSEGKLIIHTTTSAVAMNASNIEGLAFTMMNPKIGKNVLLCDDEIGYPRDGYGNTSPGQIEFIQKGTDPEHFNNVLTKRWGNPDNCNDKDECVPFELNLTEFDLKTKKVSGTFSGKVFEDRPAKKACADSYQHILSGEFSLTMLTNPEESFDTPAYDPKNRPSEQYDKPTNKPTVTSAPTNDDDDLKPLKPTPKQKPKPKPKKKDDEIKPFE